MLPVPHPAVIYKSVSDSGVLLHTEQEIYFGLNKVGARVWELLPPACTTVDQLCDTLRGEYPEVDPDALRADITGLLGDLTEQGLVVSASNNKPANENGLAIPAA